MCAILYWCKTKQKYTRKQAMQQSGILSGFSSQDGFLLT